MDLPQPGPYGEQELLQVYERDSARKRRLLVQRAQREALARASGDPQVAEEVTRALEPRP